MDKTTYSGSSLEEALKNDSLSQSGIELTGMVKSSEKKGQVCFTRSGCTNWVDLPIGMIEEAEKIGKNTCKDHSHPVMRITFKKPENPESQIFLALLSNTTPHDDSNFGGSNSPPPPPDTSALFVSDFGRNAPPQPWLNGGLYWNTDLNRIVGGYRNILHWNGIVGGGFFGDDWPPSTGPCTTTCVNGKLICWCTSPDGTPQRGRICGSC